MDSGATVGLLALAATLLVALALLLVRMRSLERRLSEGAALARRARTGALAAGWHLAGSR